MLLKKQLPSVRKLLRRKTLERESSVATCTTFWCTYLILSDVPEGVIRVHAPLLSKVSMAIQLNNQTKAKDILAKFQYENSPAVSELSFHLHPAAMKLSSSKAMQGRPFSTSVSKALWELSLFPNHVNKTEQGRPKQSFPCALLVSSGPVGK
ncbi:hypothetical protein P7K49_028377 [Saguinus oedipus]|uniref:RHG40/28/18 C-terminal ubiquitin-like domain-containing protein n=1 Tax=Saguinus oedipus TaxID=9490 RepID=A0ABQ9UC39_SAGOE|nr:hypothetical protein P7K49_028377 [Saguinus oedipus]